MIADSWCLMLIIRLPITLPCILLWAGLPLCLPLVGKSFSDYILVLLLVSFLATSALDGDFLFAVTVDPSFALSLVALLAFPP